MALSLRKAIQLPENFRNKILILLFRHFIFWMVLFQVTRSIFLIWNREEISGIPFSQFITVFYHGFYLDTTMASYMIIPSFLFLSIGMYTQKNWAITINRYITSILIFITFAITFSELPIYDEWHTKLNYKAIWFLHDPSEVLHTASWSQLLLGLVAMTVFTWLFKRMHRRIAHPRQLPDRNPLWLSILSFPLCAFLIFYGMRGGLQQIPIQVSDAYFSDKNILNVTSANSTFNLLSSILENSKAGKPYHFLDEKEVERSFTEMHVSAKDTTIHVLTTERPNVVLVILEGWSADAVKPCGGYDSIAPFFNQMSDSGILFSNTYSSGSLSDQGMAAIFSAFPAQPKTSIITQPSKYVHLPSINSEFKKAGYHTSYMFGGQLSYGNIRAYMFYHQFDRIKEDKDLDPSYPRVKLGIPDEYLFREELKQLSTEKEPFFSGFFTLSTHGPFDTPMPIALNWGGKEKLYINSIHYSDNCIREFITSAKKYPWYRNTLFVFVSDHSHNSPKNWAFNQPEYRKIPMLFYGNVIKPEFRGMLYDSVASQTDLAATLLNQLNMDAGPFHYSKNLFNPYTKHFAFYTFDEGFGYVQENNSHLTWNVDGRIEYELSKEPADKEKMLHDGKVILQYLSKEYAEY